MKNIKLFEEFAETGRWKIYSGLSGGFGGANYIKTITGTEEEANQEAYQAAVEEYESYAGTNGLRSIEDIIDEDEVDYEEAEQIFNEEREGWLDYYVKKED